jgi:hypothetical protein
MKKRINLIIILVLLMTQLACKLSNSVSKSMDAATANISAHFSGQTDLATHDLEVRQSQGFGEVEVHMDIEIERGTLTWKLIDPEGEVRWNGSAVDGQTVREDQSYKSMAGIWLLEIITHEATGQYDILMEAR